MRARLTIFAALLTSAAIGDASAERPNSRRFSGVNPSVILGEETPPGILIEIDGQSLGLGNNTTAITTLQPYLNQRVSGTSLIPLVETTLESPASTMCNTWTNNNPGSRCVVHNAAVAATAYSGLAQGTSPYNNGLTARTNAIAAWALQNPGVTLADWFLMVFLGENDTAIGRTAAQFAADMVTWRNNKATDSGATNVVMVHTQNSNWNRLATALDHATVAMGQDDVARANPTTHWRSHPLYPFPFTALDLHLTGTGQTRNGCASAKALDAYSRAIEPDSPGGTTITAGEVFQGLHATEATCNGNVVTVTFAGGRGTSGLVIDQTNVPPKPAYGFEYAETGTQQTDLPVITSAVITDDYEMQFTLNRNCSSAATPRFRYAYSAIPNTSAGNTSAGAPGGNIRNNDDWECDNGTTEPDWLWGFDLPISTCTGCTPSTVTAFSNTQSWQGSTTQWLSGRRVQTLDGATAATWSIWVRADTSWPGSDRGIWVKNDTNQSQFAMIARAGGIIRMVIAQTTTSPTAYCEINGLVANTDYLIGFTYVGGGTPTLTPYLQGQPVTCSATSGTLPAALTSNTTSDWSIGSTVGGGTTNTFVGNLSHASAWTVGLGAVDHRTLYGGGRPIDSRDLATDPVHYYQLQGNGEDLGTATPSRPLFPYGGSFGAWEISPMLSTRSAGCGQTPPCTAGNYCEGGANQTMTSASLTRTWGIFVPSTYSNTTPRRLVLSYHGCSWTPSTFRNQDGIPFELRDLNRSIYAYPAGLPNANPTACPGATGWEFESDFGTNEDLVFTQDLMDRLERTYCLLPQHVYRGSSLGSGFVATAISEMENRIAGAALTIGAVFDAAFVALSEYNGTTPVYYQMQSDDFVFNSAFIRGSCGVVRAANAGLATPVPCVITDGGAGNPQATVAGSPLDGSVAGACGPNMESDAGAPSCAALGRAGLCCTANNPDGGATVTHCECQVGGHNHIGSGDAGENAQQVIWLDNNQTPRNAP